MSTVAEDTAELLAVIGGNIRTLRAEQGMTLQSLADRTGLSPSMLSLLERGKTGPSIGTLVGVAAALGVQLGDLLATLPEGAEVVSRSVAQPVLGIAAGVTRRVLRQDRLRGIKIDLDEYAPGASRLPAPAHGGAERFEYGLVLEGALEVTLGDRTHALGEGDLISLGPAQPHRIANAGPGPARALWVHLKRV